MTKTYYLIYKVTNNINGKFYIGTHKTKNINDDYMGSGKYLNRAKIKYGLENFTKEILFIFDTPEEMYSKEKEIVSEDFLATENTYNLKIGGFGGWDFTNKNKINLYGNNGKPGFGGENLSSIHSRNYSEEKLLEIKNKIRTTKAALYKSGEMCSPFKGKVHSKYTKSIIGKKSSIHQAGERNSQFGTMWITNGIENKKINKDYFIPEGWVKGRKMKYRNLGD